MNRAGNNLAEFRRHLRFLEQIVDNSCDEIYVTDGRGITIYANPASEQHYGIPVSELIGKSVWELEQRGIYFPAVTPIVLREKKRVTIDQETGIGKTLMITATPIFDSSGEIEMVICNSRDITALVDMKRNFDEINLKVLKQPQRTEKLEKTDSLRPIYAPGSSMEQVMMAVNKIAVTDSTVLLLGESGTGKDMMARYIHQLNHRRDKQFLKVNCAALPKELLESELFGYKPGAFTGASPKGKAGLFSLASGGTIFLDEIGELPLRLQPKLLQVIEEQEFNPIGSNQMEKVDVRIISSSNQDLHQMIAKGRFREDLFYRLFVLSVQIPPLRKREGDIATLIWHFLGALAEKHGRKMTFGRRALDALNRYSWPGNVRELKHLLEYLTVVVGGYTIDVKDLPPHLMDSLNWNNGKTAIEEKTLAEALEAVERELVVSSYKELGSSYKVACRLGISQSSASRKIRKYLGE